MDCAFSNQFGSSKKRKKNKAILLSVAQRKEENLREYIQYFNVEHHEVAACSDDVAMVALTSCLKKSNNKDMIRSFYLTPEDFDFIVRRAED